MEHKSHVPVEVKFNDDAGAFVAKFSVFNQIDKDGDVTVPGAFEPGARVKIAAWGHNWLALPVGKGTIETDGDAARVHGQFFLNTSAGRETYETVKALGADQEWSYGFKVLDSKPGDFGGQQVRFLHKLQPFEVSPVMVGAGNDTGTELIKSADFGLDGLGKTGIEALTSMLATARARADMRERKEGRALSTANREQLAGHLAELRKLADEIEAFLTATAPQADGGKSIDAHALYAEFLRIDARLNGAAV